MRARTSDFSRVDPPVPPDALLWFGLFRFYNIYFDPYAVRQKKEKIVILGFSSSESCDGD